jgi:hypothetical protein
MRTARGITIDAIEAAQDNLITANRTGQVGPAQFSRVMDHLLAAKVDLTTREEAPGPPLAPADLQHDRVWVTRITDDAPVPTVGLVVAWHGRDYVWVVWGAETATHYLGHIGAGTPPPEAVREAMDELMLRRREPAAGPGRTTG